jgi:hypothetical protein
MTVALASQDGRFWRSCKAFLFDGFQGRGPLSGGILL